MEDWTVVPRRERTADKLRDIMAGMFDTLDRLGYDPKRCDACEWVDGASEDSTKWIECQRNCGAIFCHYCLSNLGVDTDKVEVLCWKHTDVFEGRFTQKAAQQPASLGRSEIEAAPAGCD